MSTRRPISRVCLVLHPREGSGPARAEPTLDLCADLIAHALGAHGVHVGRHLIGAAPESSRVDVAVWLPSPEGSLPKPDGREVAARSHVALVVSADAAADSARFDAALVAHESFTPAVRRAQERAPGGDGLVSAALLCASVSTSRDAEKAARRVPGLPVIVIDVRDRFEADIDRTVFQLALMTHPAAVILLVPHEEQARGRTRQLCDRQGVDAWMVSGTDGLLSALPAADLLIGRPSWDELWLCAAHHCGVTWLGGEGSPHTPLAAALLGDEVDEVAGVLHLGGFLDRRLKDIGGLAARGTLLNAACVGEARGLLEALGEVHPRAGARGRGGWERVGPHAEDAPPPVSAVVDAKEPGAPAQAEDRAAQIEDALSQLKARIESESGA